MASAKERSAGRGRAARAGVWLIAALALAAVVALLGSTTYGPFLPVMAADLGVGIPLLGQLPAASMLLAAVLGLIVGPLADPPAPRGCSSRSAGRWPRAQPPPRPTRRRPRDASPSPPSMGR